MEQEYSQFVTVLGALGILVVGATFVERVLAFTFEHEWFVRLFMREEPDPTDNTKTRFVSKVPGLKGLIALGLSIFLCFRYQFDVLHVLFDTSAKDEIGKVLTAFILAGGSAGAIAIFQGYLNINKDTRDAMIAAKKTQAEALKIEAESAKQVAELKTKEQAEKVKQAKAEREEAELRKNRTADGTGITE